jgi:hypothetical protein
MTVNVLVNGQLGHDKRDDLGAKPSERFKFFVLHAGIQAVFVSEESDWIKHTYLDTVASEWHMACHAFHLASKFSTATGKHLAIDAWSCSIDWRASSLGEEVCSTSSKVEVGNALMVVESGSWR